MAIELGDTVDDLQERIKTNAEHEAFPEALKLIVRGKVALGEDGKAKWNL